MELMMNGLGDTALDSWNSIKVNLYSNHMENKLQAPQ